MYVHVCECNVPERETLFSATVVYIILFTRNNIVSPQDYQQDVRSEA